MLFWCRSELAPAAFVAACVTFLLTLSTSSAVAECLLGPSLLSYCFIATSIELIAASTAWTPLWLVSSTVLIARNREPTLLTITLRSYLSKIYTIRPRSGLLLWPHLSNFQWPDRSDCVRKRGWSLVLDLREQRPHPGQRE